MNHIGLFEGIGGFSLAARWMDWETIAWCEINPFCQTVLKHHFPNAKAHSEIKSTDFTVYRGLCDILTGGFPCQPYSVAGQRKGKEDDRHLWPEMLRAIREIQPTWIVGENVRGLVSWNGGMVFDEVQSDLEAEGYNILPFILPACGVNAPHRRERVWFIAYSYSNDARRHGHGEIGCQTGGNQSKQEEWQRFRAISERISTKGIVTDSICYAREKVQTETREPISRQEYISNGQKRRIDKWEAWPTQSPIHNGDDGVPARLDFAAVFATIKYPRQPARAFGKWRNESIKAGGNAIVPQVALQIYKAIEAFQSP